MFAAWTEATAPGTFWAYHASSSPVELIRNYWEYHESAQLNMAPNCSSDIVAVIEYMDNVLEHGSAADKLALKTKFGMETVEHDDDFMQ